MVFRAVRVSRPICLPHRLPLAQASLPPLGGYHRPYSDSAADRFNDIFSRRKTGDEELDEEDHDSFLSGSWNTATNTIESVARSSHLDTEDTRTSAAPEPFPEEPLPRQLPKRRDFQHELLRKQMLSVGALGKSVDALILKNPNNLYRKKRPQSEPVVQVQDDTTLPASSSVSLFSEMLPKEQEDGSNAETSSSDLLAEALQNIDEMRPSSLNTLRRKEFDTLATELLQGFTYNQLIRYLAAHKSSLPEKADTETNGWIEQRGSWRAASPMEWTGGLRPKQRAVLLILQLVWGLEVSEEIEGMGRTPIWVRPTALQLLSDPAGSVIDSIRSDFLDESRGENIVVRADESLIMIYASKPAADHVIKQMDLVLQATKTRTVSAAHVHKSDLEPNMLRDVGRATRTDVQYLADEGTLVVSWLPDDSHSSTSTTEDPADLVSRLLVRPHDFDREVSAVIPAPTKRTNVQTGTFQPHRRDLKGVTWRDRMLPWYRYVAPVRKRTKDQKGKSRNYGLAKKPYLPLMHHEKEPDELDHYFELNATFGHVLHQVKEDTKIGNIQGRRIISPLMPHPSAFTKFDTHSLSRTIILSFTSPDGVEIQLHLSVRPETSTTSPADLLTTPSAKLFHRRTETIVDVLLPYEICDLRATQTRHEPINPAAQPSLREFLAASDFNLATGRLRTPPLEVHFTLGGPAAAEHTPTYRLSSARLATTVSLLDSPALRITTTLEGGASPAQHEEISIHASIPVTQRKKDTREEVTKFLSLAEEIILGKTFPWTNSGVPVRSRVGKDERRELKPDEGWGVDDEGTAPKGSGSGSSRGGHVDQETPSWPSNITFGSQGEHMDWWAEHVEKKKSEENVQVDEGESERDNRDEMMPPSVEAEEDDESGKPEK